MPPFLALPADSSLRAIYDTAIALHRRPSQITLAWVTDYDDQEWIQLFDSQDVPEPEPETSEPEPAPEVDVDAWRSARLQQVQQVPCDDPECDFMGATLSGMRSHFARMHKPKPPPTDDSTEPFPSSVPGPMHWSPRDPMLACDDCDYLCKVSTEMFTHTNGVHGRSPSRLERTPLAPETRAERVALLKKKEIADEAGSDT